MLKDLMISLSLANLCFIQVWVKILTYGNSDYFRKVPLPMGEFVAIIFNVLLLAVLFWSGMTIVRRSNNPLAMRSGQGLFLLATFLVLNGFRMQVQSLSLSILLKAFGMAGVVIGGLAFFIVIFYLVMRWYQRTIGVAVTLVLIMCPFVIVTFSQSVWALINYHVKVSSLADKPLATSLTTRTAAMPRIVWIVFDELDERLAFEERPSTVNLPEFDRFCSEAIYATNAYPPAGATILSMPALITGKLISKAKSINSDELQITFGNDKKAVNWSEQPNIFSKAREAGFNTAVVGWYHPYGRLLNGNLTSCYWQAYYETLEYGDMKLSDTMLRQGRSLIDIIPLAGRLGFTKKGLPNRSKHMMTYSSVLAEANKAATDSNQGLVLLHLPVPHPPGIYNRFENKFVTDGKSSYLDNLVLADHTLGQIRHEMEAAGLWEGTTILITADHWWRTDIWLSSAPTSEDVQAGNKIDHRVPFMLKLAGQREPLTYVPEFNTVLIHDMLLAVLHGAIPNTNSARNWLDEHRTFGESPYNKNE